jgi:hypothetical protein
MNQSRRAFGRSVTGKDFLLPPDRSFGWAVTNFSAFSTHIRSVYLSTYPATHAQFDPIECLFRTGPCPFFDRVRRVEKVPKYPKYKISNL